MFVALKADDSLISLLSKNWTREELEEERECHTFFCPECRGRLTLKLGRYQVWHFAHSPNSRCSMSSLGETEEHRRGKWLLFSWLKDNGFKPNIEHYLPPIKQRPDIHVQIDHRSYAFELQRSALPEEVFIRRNEVYMNHGIEPVWIGAASALTRLGSWQFAPRHLDRLLLRPSAKPHAIYLLNEAKAFLLLSHFYTINGKRMMAFPMKVPLSVYSPQQLVHNALPLPEAKLSELRKYKEIYLLKWLTETKNKRLRRYRSLTATERMMLRLLQQHRCSLNYFPALGNLPLSTNFYFRTAPQWWQSWIIMEVINKIPLYDTLRLTLLTNRLSALVDKGVFHLLPSYHLHKKQLIRAAAAEYLDCLCLFHAVKKQYAGVYQIVKHIHIEKQLDILCMDDHFVQKKITDDWNARGN